MNANVKYLNNIYAL